jgi:hypothetical protein
MSFLLSRSNFFEMLLKLEEQKNSSSWSGNWKLPFGLRCFRIDFQLSLYLHSLLSLHICMIEPLVRYLISLLRKVKGRYLLGPYLPVWYMLSNRFSTKGLTGGSSHILKGKARGKKYSKTRIGLGYTTGLVFLGSKTFSYSVFCFLIRKRPVECEEQEETWHDLRFDNLSLFVTFDRRVVRNILVALLSTLEKKRIRASSQSKTCRE